MATETWLKAGSAPAPCSPPSAGRIPTYRVRRALETDRDLEPLADLLFEAYRSFGDSVDEALARVEHRLDGVEAFMASLAEDPHRGSPRPQLFAGLERLTRGRVVPHFEIDDAAWEVRILGVFLGGKDHHRHVLMRLDDDG